MPGGSDLPVRTKRLLNKVDGWGGRKKGAQKGKTDSRGEMCAKILRQPLIHTRRMKKGQKKSRGVEEEAVHGMKSSFHVGVKVGRRMGNEAQQRLAPGFG